MTEQLFNVYGVMVVEFLVEYGIFNAITLRRLERKEHFVLRAILTLVVIFAIGIPVAAVYLFIGETAIGRIVIYLFLFVITTLGVFFCFDENYRTVLFCCSVAYVLLSLSYKSYLVIWTFGEQNNLYEHWGDNFDLYAHILYYGIIALCLIPSYFLFLRTLEKKIKDSKINKKMLMQTLMVLVVTLVLCSVEDVAFLKLCVERENKFDVPIYYEIRQAGNLFSMACCLATLMLASKTLESDHLLKEVEYLKYAVRQGEKEYQISKETIDMINLKCHDIKYKISELSAGGKISSDSVDELRDVISIYDSKIETGNKFLDVLITEVSLYCEHKGINFSCMIDGTKLEFMEIGDLYCLFGNFIDNALEAVAEIEEKEKAVINISVTSHGNMIVIQEDNYFSGQRDFENGLPVTTKTDKNNHGFGIRSINAIVKKYGGETSISIDKDIFHLSILFAR